jgi:hypothetical protein
VTTPPKDGTGPDQVAAPTVSTAPSGGTAEAPHTSWWHWKRLPHHLGRARTSTVILSVLFLAIFTLYLNVRPDPETTGTTPAGGSSDVQTPTNPVVPTEPTPEPEPTEEPSPTTEPEETETPSEDSGSPTTGSTTSSPDPGTTEPTTEPSDPTETSDPSGTTSPTTEPSTSSPSPTG